MSRRSIHYIQYTNPAALPILEHGGLIFQRAGYEVSYFGVIEPDARDRFAPHADLAARTKLWPTVPPGWRQKLHFLFFIFFNVWQAVRRPGGWVYASDLNGCPAAYLIARLRLARVIYHEHHTPDPHAAGRNLVGRVLLALHRRLARRADLAVLPNRERAQAFETLRRPSPPVQVVLNCPRRSEVGPARAPWTGEPLRVLYHGSIVPDRLPLSVIEAVARLAGRVVLSIVGPVPTGAAGYLEHLSAHAATLGAGDYVHAIGLIPDRADLLAFSATQDVGLAFMPTRVDDLNMQHTAGASQKPFDYLAVGMALLVSDEPEWRSFYVEPSYALACDPDDAGALAGAFQKFLDDPARMRDMGERGRQRIASDWNYETQFAPVLQWVDRLTVPARAS